MAKLSARGRTVQVEAVREYSAAQLQAQHDRIYPGKVGETPLTQWERKTRRLMSDGTILEKLDVKFQPDWLDKTGRRHSYGWKVHGKLKAGITAADFARVYSAPRKDGSPSSWTITSTTGRVKTPVLSLARVMRAIESGESIGFCLECGADQYGVEPDANGYKCESCGQHAVQGAEDVLAGMSI
jgi:hypothetical protein